LTGERRRPDHRGALGLRGEALAEAVLRRTGMRVLERRFRLRCGEIDLIAEDAGVIVFVEVKTRRGTGYGWPAESVTAAKRRRMARTALAYLKLRSALERRARFDVVEVIFGSEARPETRHIRDAFRIWPTG
jgi:putative endonuclease